MRDGRLTKVEDKAVEEWGEVLYYSGLLNSPGEARQWINRTKDDLVNDSNWEARTMEQHDTINEFVVVGEFGFDRVEGPFSVEKEGTNWEILIPLNENDRSSIPDHQQSGLRSHEGERAVLLADTEPIGGGVIELVDEPEGEEMMVVLVDQYAMGDV
jgi:hypothetical protein